MPLHRRTGSQTLPGGRFIYFIVCNAGHELGRSLPWYLEHNRSPKNKTSRAGTSQAGHCSRESALRNSNLQSRGRVPVPMSFYGPVLSLYPLSHRWMQSLTSYLDVQTLQLFRWQKVVTPGSCFHDWVEKAAAEHRSTERCGICFTVLVCRDTAWPQRKPCALRCSSQREPRTSPHCAEPTMCPPPKSNCKLTASGPLRSQGTKSFRHCRRCIAQGLRNP